MGPVTLSLSTSRFTVSVGEMLGRSGRQGMVWVSKQDTRAGTSRTENNTFSRSPSETRESSKYFTRKRSESVVKMSF
jgi:hypothetical protein